MTRPGRDLTMSLPSHPDRFRHAVLSWVVQVCVELVGSIRGWARRVALPPDPIAPFGVRRFSSLIGEVGA